MNVVATTVTVGGRMLTTEALAIGAALDAGDLDGARGRLPALVGRDPSSLSADEVARAVVESVAENSVDAVVAPVFWGTAAGGIGALAYRAINTMDAMVGHHSDRFEQFGWASARLDDLVNWVPARVAAALVALLRPRRAREVWRAVRVDAPRHPSPNAGVVEAAFAAALDLRLGGVNRYGDRVEERAALGRGRAPDRGRHRGRGAPLPPARRGDDRGVGGRCGSTLRGAASQGGLRGGGSLAAWLATSSTRSG